MARYTESVCRLCRREGAKLFLKGSALLFQEVRLRASPDASRPARRPPPQGRRVRPPAAREAEGPPHVRRPRAPVPQLLRRRREPARRDRREPAPLARAAPRQRRLPDGLRASRAQARQFVAPRPLRRQRPARPTSRRTSSSPATGSRSARPIAPASRSRSPRRPSAIAPGAGVADDRSRPACPGPSSTPPSRDQMPLDLNEQLVVEYYSR